MLMFVGNNSPYMNLPDTHILLVFNFLKSLFCFKFFKFDTLLASVQFVPVSQQKMKTFARNWVNIH